MPGIRKPNKRGIGEVEDGEDANLSRASSSSVDSPSGSRRVRLDQAGRSVHLGRAKDISEFVRYGSREAEIEIELAADPVRHGQNPVIRRHIKREGNKTTWFLDGRS
ncbi:hypothetical protein LTR28_001840, partial [Elasticomyces elasticus]